MQHAKRTKRKTRIVIAAAAASVLLAGTAVGAGALESAETSDAGAQSDAGAGEIRGADAPGTVDGEYIVVMKRTGEEAADSKRLKTHTTVRALADSLLSGVDAGGAAVKRTFATALKGFTVTGGRGRGAPPRRRPRRRLRRARTASSAATAPRTNPHLGPGPDRPA